MLLYHLQDIFNIPYLLARVLLDTLLELIPTVVQSVANLIHLSSTGNQPFHSLKERLKNTVGFNWTN